MRALYYIFSCILLSVLISSCTEEEITPNAIKGTYEGTFTQQSTNETARVSIELGSSSFTGSTNLRNFPAIGTGAFSIEGSQIQFTNASFWTADFDWTLILEGKFSYEVEDDKLILTKTEQGKTQTYVLTKTE